MPVTGISLTFFINRVLLLYLYFFKKIIIGRVYLSYRYIYLSMTLQPLWTLAAFFFKFRKIYKISRTPCTGDGPVAVTLPTHKITQTQNKRTQTSKPQVGFEPTTPVFERVKTVHALDLAVTVIGSYIYIYTSRTELQLLFHRRNNIDGNL
jgi:hypothetical protein